MARGLWWNWVACPSFPRWRLLPPSLGAEASKLRLSPARRTTSDLPPTNGNFDNQMTKYLTNKFIHPQRASPFSPNSARAGSWSIEPRQNRTFYKLGFAQIFYRHMYPKCERHLFLQKCCDLKSDLVSQIIWLLSTSAIRFRKGTRWQMMRMFYVMKIWDTPLCK